MGVQNINLIRRMGSRFAHMGGNLEMRISVCAPGAQMRHLAVYTPNPPICRPAVLQVCRIRGKVWGEMGFSGRSLTRCCFVTS